MGTFFAINYNLSLLFNKNSFTAMHVLQPRIKALLSILVEHWSLIFDAVTRTRLRKSSNIRSDQSAYHISRFVFLPTDAGKN